MKKNLLTILAAVLFAANAKAQCSNVCTFVSSAQATGSSTSVTVNKPAGVQQSDIMIAAVHTGWCQSGSGVSAPAGWTLINQTSNTGSGCGSGNSSVLLATFYKIAGASEPASYTFTGSTTQLYVGGIVAYSGVDTLNPINATSNNGNQDSCSSIVAPGLVTTLSCTRLVSVFFCSVNSWATNIIPQNSLTERLDVGNTGNHPWGNENLEISDEAMSSMGASGSRSAALSGCSGDGWPTGAQMIALACQVTTTNNQHKFSASAYSLLPNPSAGIFDIVLQEKPVMDTNVEIFDCLGKCVRKFQLTEKKTSADLSALPKGMYFVKIGNETGSGIQKILVQ